MHSASRSIAILCWSTALVSCASAPPPVLVDVAREPYARLRILNPYTDQVTIVAFADPKCESAPQEWPNASTHGQLSLGMPKANAETARSAIEFAVPAKRPQTLLIGTRTRAFDTRVEQTFTCAAYGQLEFAAGADYEIAFSAKGVPGRILCSASLYQIDSNLPDRRRLVSHFSGGDVESPTCIAQFKKHFPAK